MVVSRKMDDKAVEFFGAHGKVFQFIEERVVPIFLPRLNDKDPLKRVRALETYLEISNPIISTAVAHLRLLRNVIVHKESYTLSVHTNHINKLLNYIIQYTNLNEKLHDICHAGIELMKELNERWPESFPTIHKFVSEFPTKATGTELKKIAKEIIRGCEITLPGGNRGIFCSWNGSIMKVRCIDNSCNQCKNKSSFSHKLKLYSVISVHWDSVR